MKLNKGRAAIATLVATGVLIGGTASVASAAPVKGKTVASKSTTITVSYTHLWSNGRCSLLGVPVRLH